MFQLHQHKIFIGFSFPLNYGLKVISVCGDNSTEYDYEGFMLENLPFMEKLENLFSSLLYLWFFVVIQIFVHQQLHGFHIVVTCSSAKSESISDISEEIRKYCSKLIKPLATNTSLKELFDMMKEEVISKFESKINEQNDKIYELESRVAIQKQTVNNLLTKCADNEQYSRHSSLPIHGI